MTPHLLRIAECCFLLALGFAALLRLEPAYIQHPAILLFVMSEVLNMILIVVQRPGVTNTRMYPVTLAFLGTSMALLVVPSGDALLPKQVCTWLIIFGTLIAIAAKLSLRRSFGMVAANRGVKKDGAYRYVRHPMYLGYMIAELGFLSTYFSLQNVAIYAFVWWCFWLRAVEEEKVLLLDPTYERYATRVRARLIPGVL